MANKRDQSSAKPHPETGCLASEQAAAFDEDRSRRAMGKADRGVWFIPILRN